MLLSKAGQTQVFSRWLVFLISFKILVYKYIKSVFYMFLVSKYIRLTKFEYLDPELKNETY